MESRISNDEIEVELLQRSKTGISERVEGGGGRLCYSHVTRMNTYVLYVTRITPVVCFSHLSMTTLTLAVMLRTYLGQKIKDEVVSPAHSLLIRVWKAKNTHAL